MLERQKIIEKQRERGGGREREKELSNFYRLYIGLISNHWLVEVKICIGSPQFMPVIEYGIGHKHGSD